MAALLDRRRELDAAIAEVSAELKRAKRQARDKAKSEAKAWQLSDFLRHSALIVYALADYSALPAAKFLSSAGRKRHWPERSEEDMIIMVEELFIQVDERNLADLTDVHNPVDVEAMKAALPYVEEWRLVSWTTKLNALKGVAPSLEAILTQAERHRLQLPEAVRPAGHGTNVEVRARMWAGAWRERWGGRYGALRFREDVPLSQMRDKVITATRPPDD